jgi:hypothetical protein
VSAINGAQRTARPTKPHGNLVSARLLHPSVPALAPAEFFDCGE